MVPKVSKKRKFKGKSPAVQKKLKFEAPQVKSNPALEICAGMSDATKNLVAKLMKKKESQISISKQPDVSVEAPKSSALKIQTYTGETQNLISKIRKDLLTQKPSASLEQKQILKLQEYLDATLNFLGTRHSEWIPLKEVQQSMAMTQGKTFTLTNLRQILFFCKDFYEVKWQE